MSLIQIASFTAILLPYSLKALWAPLCDRFELKPLERQRSWICLSQWALALLFAYITHLNPHTHYQTIFLLAVLAAILSATQDIAIGSYCIHMLSSRERPQGMSYHMAANRFSYVIAGGITLIIADHVNWNAAYHLMAALMLICNLALFFSPPTKPPIQPHQRLRLKSMLDGIIQKFPNRKKAFFLLFILVFIKLDDAFILTLGPTFLLRNLHLTLTQLGLITKIIGFASVLMGSLMAGVLCTRTSASKTLIIAGAFQVLTTLGYTTLAITHYPNIVVVGIVVASEMFSAGMIGTTLASFLMEFCDIQWAASHYAFLSAIPSLCRSTIGPLGGFLVAYTSWATYFTIASLSMVMVLTAVIIAERKSLLEPYHA